MLAKELGITSVAVRQHLSDLETEKLVEPHQSSTSGGRGRPAVTWRLTPAADDFFPNGHEELAVGLIHGLRAAFGEAGIQRLVESRTATQIKAYRKALSQADALRQRLELLADIRTREGYMAAVEEADGGYLLVEHHCPICAAARVCTGLCSSELEVFQEVLGEDVRVERTDHVLAGANRCAYRVTDGRGQ